MIEFLGTIATRKRRINVEVALDSIAVGTLHMNLDQWNRLREHRREGGPSLATGLQLIVEATDEEP